MRNIDADPAPGFLLRILAIQRLDGVDGRSATTEGI
jgi:hypothetical protein